jgi:colanic acid biosynthesis glycosyl transferase WcaI
MSHILFISRYYLPEEAAATVCVSETAQGLVRLGHQVTVLTTFPNYPIGVVPPEYRGKIRQEEVINGVRVIRVWSYISANKGFLRRILAQLSFGCFAPFLAGRAVGRPDVIIVGSPPLFNVIAARMLAVSKRCPLIFWVADIWPESAIQLGVLRNRVLIRLSEWLEESTYQKASLVWVVTDGMRDALIARGLALEHIFLLTNGVDCTKFRPQAKAQARVELGWDDRFTVLYTGGHGIMHGLTMILDAAERMLDREDVHIILVGEGSEKSDLIAQSQRRHLKNVTFLDAQPHERIPLLVAASDVSLVPARKIPLFRGMLPIKMLETMACARPMVLAVDGEARRVAEQEAKAAIAVEPENAAALVAAILYLYEHPERAEEMGQRGRDYVKAYFDYDQLTADLSARLALMLNTGDSPSALIASNSAEVSELSLAGSLSGTPGSREASLEKS